MIVKARKNWVDKKKKYYKILITIPKEIITDLKWEDIKYVSIKKQDKELLIKKVDDD